MACIENIWSFPWRWLSWRSRTFKLELEFCTSPSKLLSKLWERFNWTTELSFQIDVGIDPSILLLERSKVVIFDWFLKKVGNSIRLQDTNSTFVILGMEDIRPTSAKILSIDKWLCESPSVVGFTSLSMTSSFNFLFNLFEDSSRTLSDLSWKISVGMEPFKSFPLKWRISNLEEEIFENLFNWSWKLLLESRILRSSGT